jgi:molybdopterin-biosynthesis enzyme MoeA-like protein
MLGGLKNKISGGKPILSKTINLRTVESEIAKPLKEVQENNIDVEIGSYPFFKSDKVGVAIVLRSEDESKISICNNQILKFINSKKIQLIDKD